MSGFTGVAGDSVRDKVQVELSKSIGNESTRPRSIELAIRIENAIYERCGRRTTGNYELWKELAKKFADPRQGFEFNSRLLGGMTTPERLVEEEIPEPEEPVIKSVKKETKKPAPVPASASSSSSSQPKPAASTSSPATGPVTAALSSTSISAASSSASTSSATSSSASTTLMQEDKPATGSSPSPPPGDSSNSGTASPKLEQKSKTQASSYYFFSSTDPETAKKFAPKPIDPAEIANDAPTVAVAGATTSKWNVGGTFEERDVSQWARGRLSELLGEIVVPAFQDGNASFGSWKVTGETTAVFTRGKKRVGYELVVKTSFHGTYQSKDVTGDVEIPSLDNICGFDPDFKISVTAQGSGEHDEVVRRAVMKVIPNVRAKVDEFLKELADK